MPSPDIADASPSQPITRRSLHAFPMNTVVVGTRSVARFWSSSFGHQFYTADTAERDGLIRREAHVWAYEGESFRVPNG